MLKGIVALAGLSSLSLVGAASAGVITSSNFSVGYGFYGTTWNTTETASANTAPTGDFNLSVTLTGAQSSSAGPQFPNRVLLNGGTTVAQGGNGSYASGSPTGFSATVTGSYTGPTPADAAANPNYQIEVNITGISIYGRAGTGVSGQTFNFTETTAGNTQTQANQAVPAGVASPGPNDAAAYTKFSWDPNEFLSVIGLTSQTRTFGVSIKDSNGNATTTHYLDGFEVFGNVVVHYDTAVPEPASMGVLAAGGLLMLGRRRRKA